MPPIPPRPPPNGAQLRKQLIAQYGISSAAGLALVDTAARALDQARAAERQLQKDGLTVDGGRRAHPCLKAAHDARSRLLAALRALNIEEL